MEKTDKIKQTYFQFRSESRIPVYMRVNLDEFNPDLAQFFVGMGFEQLSENDAKKAQAIIIAEPSARVLKISEATPYVARQIDRRTVGVGDESVTPRDGYKVYRYFSKALLVYSFRAREWSMGCFSDFGEDQKILASKIIINRYLAWALAPHGIMGFWGVPVDEGVVIMRPEESLAEAVYIDIKGSKVFSIEGSQKIKSRFNIMRLNKSIHGKNIKMSQEELLSFLTMNSAYFDHKGLSVPVRQIIQLLSKTAIGLIHPEENFRPRADLSL